MKGLEVDLIISGAHSENDPEIIEFKKNSEPLQKEDKRDKEAVAFSKKIIAALEDKGQKHNTENLRQVAVSQLKNVYKGGVKNESHENISVSKLAMARVNMFLKMIGERKIKDSFKKADVIKSYGGIDVYSYFEPSAEDYIMAERDIKFYGLEGYDCEDVNDLYLDTDEELRAEASAWLDNLID